MWQVTSYLQHNWYGWILIYTPNQFCRSLQKGMALVWVNVAERGKRSITRFVNDLEHRRRTHLSYFSKQYNALEPHSARIIAQCTWTPFSQNSVILGGREASGRKTRGHGSLDHWFAIQTTPTPNTLHPASPKWELKVLCKLPSLFCIAVWGLKM